MLSRHCRLCCQTVVSSCSYVVFRGLSPKPCLDWLRDLYAVRYCTVHICRMRINDEGNCVEREETLALNNLITLRLFKPSRTAYSKTGSVFEARLRVMGLFSLGKREIMRWDKGGFLAPERINSQGELSNLSIPCCGWEEIMYSRKGEFLSDRILGWKNAILTVFEWS